MKRTVKVLCLFITSIIIISFLKVSGAEVSMASGGSSHRADGAIILYVGSPTAIVNNTETPIDASNPAVKPVIKNSRALVPVRFIAQSLGAGVEWEERTGTAVVSLEGKTVRLVAGSTKMDVGNKEVSLDAPAEIINGRLFVPLRQLAEALGKSVFYDRGLIILDDKDNMPNVSSDKTLINELISRVNNLPVVGSYETLKDLLTKVQDKRKHVLWGMTKGVSMPSEESVSAKAAAADAVYAGTPAQQTDTQAAQNRYSTTNVQVEGVDEGDIVKTDGEYIYQVNKQRIVIAKAYPAENMEISNIINFADKNFVPRELYLDGGLLTVIGSTRIGNVPMYRSGTKEEAEIRPQPYYPQESVKAVIYDVKDKTDIRQLREAELEGRYVSSRRIGSNLYIVANRYMNYNYLDKGGEGLTPLYRDTAIKDEFIPVNYTEIRYFPDFIESNYMIVAALDLEHHDKGISVSTYLGAGQNIYVSQDNLYVTVTNYKPSIARTEKPVTGISEKPAAFARPEIMPPVQNETETLIYKFSLDGGKVTFLAKGAVTGTVLNQFSMDENGKYFRIATTQGDVWRSDEYTSRNNIYVLDEMLNITGSIENIAPGERIYSVRFMGDRGYMVTFKTVDPLFVIDLKDPSNPRILGALKIPGYSDYLHPYDENHIIGFGKDTVEIPQKDSNGREIGRMAFYLGLKVAIFDVTDVNNPIEMFTEKIGDRGTDSELLRNHRALLFSRDKNLLAFPVTLAEVKGAGKVSGGDIAIPQYGQFTFQGAYIYGLDLASGFKLRGRITHISGDEYLKSGNGWYNGDRNIERIMYINDTLYTLSKGMVKANSLEDLGEIKSVLVPQP